MLNLKFQSHGCHRFYFGNVVIVNFEWVREPRITGVWLNLIAIQKTTLFSNLVEIIFIWRNSDDLVRNETGWNGTRKSVGENGLDRISYCAALNNNSIGTKHS